jgi:hypothetical protein
MNFPKTWRFAKLAAFCLPFPYNILCTSFLTFQRGKTLRTHLQPNNRGVLPPVLLVVFGVDFSNNLAYYKHACIKTCLWRKAIFLPYSYLKKAVSYSILRGMSLTL